MIIFKNKNAKSILKDALKLFSKSHTSIDLYTASILASVLACHHTGKIGAENIERIAEFTASVSRGEIIRLKKE